MGEAARFGELEARKHALTAVHAFACEAAPVLAPHFADVAPLMLDCACDTSREARPFSPSVEIYAFHQMELTVLQPRYEQSIMMEWP